MKNSIFILLLCYSVVSNAQITFDGPPAAIDSLNSSNGQNYLILSPEGNKMAFTEEQGGSSQTNQFNQRTVTFNGERWEVTILPDILGAKGMMSPLAFTDQGLIYSQVTFDKGIYSGSVLFTKNGSASSEIMIPFFKNKGPIQSGCLSADGRYMILSVESNNSYGVEDLYLSKRNADGTWSSLKNLGYTINTNFQEVTPFLAADNRTLFFATNGRGGEGSFDLFYTIRQDESWRSWSSPVNLGPLVNTSGAETSFAFQDGSEWAYFVSAQDSDVYGDIMRIKIKEEIEKDTVEQYPSVDEMLTKQIMLKIVDKQTKELLTAELILDTLSLFVPGGVFVLDSVYLESGEMEVKADGYLPKMIPLSNDLMVGVNEIVLDRVKAGETFTLDHVLFHRGTPNLVHGSEKELDLVVEMMNDNPNIKIFLKGHTDNTGDPEKNLQLSEDRVSTVKEYIISQGISANRVTGKGFGGKQPIASNASEETRKLNRRVEFEIME